LILRLDFDAIVCGSDKMETMRNVLGRWGKNVKDAAKKAEDLAGNTWQHCMFFVWVY